MLANSTSTIMQRRLRPITCLSADYHDGDCITDKLSHYMGCIEFCERSDYYDSLQSNSDKAQIKTELRRIEYLRRVLLESDEKSDIKNVTESLLNWQKDNPLNKLSKVQEWSKSRNPKRRKYRPFDPNNGRRNSSTVPLNLQEYNPDKDTNAYVIQFKDGEGVTDEALMKDGETRVLRGEFPNQKISVDVLLRDPDVNPLSKQSCTDKTVRYFHIPTNNMKWVQDAIARYYDEPEPHYERPHRKRAVRTYSNSLLHRDFWLGQEHGQGSPIIHARHLRPFCEPVFSMKKAPLKKAPSADDSFDELDHQRGWKMPENIVLFMPYLHWEMDSKRESFSQLINDRSKEYQNQLRNEELDQRSFRRTERQDLHPPPEGDMSHVHSCTNGRHDTHRSHASNASARKSNFDLADYLFRFIRREPRKKFGSIIPKGPERDANGRLKTKNRLGQLLYDAFILYQTMNSYRDRKLIENYLFETPALHPRRTLDQAYYWAMQNTGVRDRDQVVYRATSARKDAFHSYGPRNIKKAETPWEWDCPNDDENDLDGQGHCSCEKCTATRRAQVSDSASASDQSQNPSFGHMSNSTNSQDKTSDAPKSDSQRPRHRECKNCREAIKKVPRLVMVDQLWMWILDEQTIITCFPRRYGMNRQDASGVHKSIRLRLERGTKVQSAYDLALVIIDECSNVFFDRTKTDVRQPQMIEIFSEAIGNMAHQQTISFNHLWTRADQLVKACSDNSSLINLDALHKGLLNITHEGKLQRETKDIIEELDIMIYITRKQRDVLKRFKKHAEAVLLERQNEAKFKKGERRQKKKRSTYGPPTPDQRTKRLQLETFKINAEDVTEAAEDHLRELESLRWSAESVCKGIDQLLALKQQQASVVQAWQAIGQGEQAVQQGRAIMIFTVITIVFLPLAFMAAIFGMNNTAIGNNQMTLGQQIRLMFSISFAVIVVVVIIAFSRSLRSLAWSFCYFCLNYMTIKLGLYSLWLRLPDWLHQDDLIKRCEKKIKEMRDDRRKAKVLRKGKEYQEWREKEKEKEEEQKAKEAAAAAAKIAQENGRDRSIGTSSGVDGEQENGHQPAPRLGQSQSSRQKKNDSPV